MVMPLAIIDVASSRARSRLRRNWPSTIALTMAPDVAGTRITYVSCAEIPMTWLTKAGARVNSMKRTSTAMVTCKNASIRPREARTTSMPSLMSLNICRKRLTPSATGSTMVRSTFGMSDANISAPATASSAAPTQ